MAELKRERLTDHPIVPPTSTSPLQGCFLVFAVPFTLAGLLAVLVGTGLLNVRIEDDTPPWLFTVMGTLFFIVGVSLGGFGISALRRIQSAQRRKQAHPNEPWLQDHDWDQRGANSIVPRHALSSLGHLLTVGLFLSLFNVAAFTQAKAPIFFVVAVIAGDVVLLWMLIGATTRLLTGFWRGRSRFHFARFPFRVGEAVDGGLEAGRGLHAARSLTVTVRYMEEALERPGRGNTGDLKVMLYCRYETTQEIALDHLDSGSRTVIPLHVSLPAGDNCSSKLLGDPRFYWELQAKAATPGIDYDAHFLLPVY